MTLVAFLSIGRIIIFPRVILWGRTSLPTSGPGTSTADFISIASFESLVHILNVRNRLSGAITAALRPIVDAVSFDKGFLVPEHLREGLLYANFEDTLRCNFSSFALVKEA